ncbi:MAG: glycerophosphodiester phosphodiesterase [bacterium]|nr:glycerophosphodiester phosphodiesterase [bacterium]
MVSGRAIILGHRGSPKIARENTLASFRLALDEGADGVELDVQITRDGIPVVCHDEELATGERLCDLSLAEMQALLEGSGGKCTRWRRCCAIYRAGDS